MALKEQINQDLKEAVKKKEELPSMVLRMLSAVLLNKEKEKRYKISKNNPEIKEQELVEKSHLTEEEIIEAVSSEVKKRMEAAVEYEKGNRLESAEKEKKEAEILKKYLPEQLSKEELEKLVAKAVQETGATSQKDMGKVMAALMPDVKGRADGSLISKIVKELLTS
jgi:hypothetical protein